MLYLTALLKFGLPNTVIIDKGYQRNKNTGFVRPIQRLVVDYKKEGSTTKNSSHNAAVQPTFGGNIRAHNAPLPNNFGAPPLNNFGAPPSNNFGAPPTGFNKPAGKKFLNIFFSFFNSLKVKISCQQFPFC